jgi:hypothetical protein
MLLIPAFRAPPMGSLRTFRESRTGVPGALPIHYIRYLAHGKSFVPEIDCDNQIHQHGESQRPSREHVSLPDRTNSEALTRTADASSTASSTTGLRPDNRTVSVVDFERKFHLGAICSNLAVLDLHV